MWKRNSPQIDGNEYVCFSGYLKDCRSCPLRQRCMRKPVKEQGRQVYIKMGKVQGTETSAIDKMRNKIDSDEGRFVYSKRLGTIEPAFGNINTTKGLDRFTLRGLGKVNAQWLMFCMVHNVEKIQRYGNID